MKQLLFFLLIFLTMGFKYSPQQADFDSSTLKKTDKKPVIELTFVLDVTGSMSGLIQTAKEKIWSIANSMTQTEPAPDIKIAIIAYRDRGDDFVTKILPLTSDLDAVYVELMKFAAGGGGDTPESVNQALHEAVTKLEWSSGDGVYKTIFLVGDSPPKVYNDDVDFEESCKIAAKAGIRINTIQMGNNSSTTPIWKEIARLAEGEFFQVDQDASSLLVSTPYDDTIAALNIELEATKIYYGTTEILTQQEKRLAKSDSIIVNATLEANTRRAIYNSSEAGLSNFLGSNELVNDVTTGSISLDTISKDWLPEKMKNMTYKEQIIFVTELNEERKKLMKRIRELDDKRQEYIVKKREEEGTDGEETFSDKVFRAVKSQAIDSDIEISGSAKH